MWRTLVLVAVVAVTGCAGASARPDPSTSRTASPASTTVDGAPGTTITAGSSTPSSSSADAVLAAVDGFGRSTIAANDPPDPTHPDLARFRTGDVLTNAVAAVSLNRQLGIAYRLAPGRGYTHTAEVLQLSDVRALVHDCVVDHAQQVNLPDGRILNDTVATKLFETKLVVVEGAWKVAENTLSHRWEGVGGCASSAPR